MKRTSLSVCFAVFAALATPAVAQDAGTRVQEEIIAQLSGQGFTHVRISNTFLGRIRIFATSPDATREIIINPRTGEILRDYWDDEDDHDDGLVSSSRKGSADGSSSGSSGGGSDDAANDNADDNADDNDSADDNSDGNSGSSSGSSTGDNSGSSTGDNSGSSSDDEKDDNEDKADKEDKEDPQDTEDDSEGDD